MATLKFFGHSCFLLENKEYSLLFDPFLTDNPFQIVKAEEIDCTHIFVSHAHFDHIGDTVAIAKRCGATVISTAEIAGFVGGQGCASHGMHIGGTHEFVFGSVRVTLAFHGAGIEGGHACGFIVHFDGKTLYFAGDTGIFGDMELLGRLEKIDYALLPIGDNFTMGPSDAALAAKLLGAKNIVPMHYNTWPLIAQDPESYKASVERQTDSHVLILQPGEKLMLA